MEGQELEEVTDEQLYQDARDPSGAGDTATGTGASGDTTPPAEANAEGQDPGGSEAGDAREEAREQLAQLPAEVVEQILAAYDPDTKKWGKRYDSPTAYVEGVARMREEDSRRGRENYERGQQRGGQPHQQQGPQQPDPVHLAGLLRQPPVKNLADQAFVSVGERLGIAWNTDENGYVLTSDPANLANAQFVRERMGGYVQETQYQEQAREQHAASLYDAAMRDTGDVDPVFVDAAFRALYEQGATGQRDWDTSEAFLSDVRAMAQQRLDAAFARRAGTQQQQKPQAPPPTLAGGQPTVGAGGARKGQGAYQVQDDYYFK